VSAIGTWRTWPCAIHMSAYDPTRTSASPNPSVGSYCYRAFWPLTSPP